jgi:hypothetical protein
MPYSVTQAWSSVREPAQVFQFLESAYSAFDRIAEQRNVFKVETIADTYGKHPLQLIDKSTLSTLSLKLPVTHSCCHWYSKRKIGSCRCPCTVRHGYDERLWKSHEGMSYVRRWSCPDNTGTHPIHSRLWR